MSFHPSGLFCDNISVMPVSYNSIIHARTKYIELNIHFVSEIVILKRMKILSVPSSVQVTYTLTKPLRMIAFQDLWTKIKVTTYIPSRSYEWLLEEFFKMASYTLAHDRLYEALVCLSDSKHRLSCTCVEECCMVK